MMPPAGAGAGADRGSLQETTHGSVSRCCKAVPAQPKQTKAGFLCSATWPAGAGATAAACRQGTRGSSVKHDRYARWFLPQRGFLAAGITLRHVCHCPQGLPGQSLGSRSPPCTPICMRTGTQTPGTLLPFAQTHRFAMSSNSSDTLALVLAEVSQYTSPFSSAYACASSVDTWRARKQAQSTIGQTITDI